MPQLNVKTAKAESIWKSPDGQREIFKVILETDAGEVEAKTYSKDISRVGWSGEVETYEKQGSRGSETFVKQPPKDTTYGGSTPSGQGGYQGKAGKSFDNFTMYLSYAKDLVVALQETGGFDKEQFETMLTATIKGGKALYAHRPDAPKEEPKVDEVHEVGDVDIADLNKLFPED